uniref:Protein kinase domain-containing protein n=1 Tax=Elaeophora elaphi TaxID=1147741 RepID=A0A0R3RPU3_9BILA
MTTDLQVIDAAYDFCQRLKARNLFFRKCQAEEELKTTANSESQNTDTMRLDTDELVKGVYPVYSKSGRRYIVKVSPGGSLETPLLLQAKKLKESNTQEDVCLPLFLDHYYHHMSSTNFFILEFCEYGSLEKLLTDSGMIPIHKQHIAKILHGVSTAIYFLHS